MTARKLKVLAIDDDAEFLRVLGTAVRSRFPGVEFLFALDGEEGLKSALANDPDVVLLDISLPGVDGYEVCRRLKSQASTRDIPVVFVTATGGGRENRVRCLKAGGDGFLTKPFEIEELEAQIRAMVKIKEAAVSKEAVRKGLAAQVEKHVSDLKLELAERIKADAALLESQQLLNGIINSMPVRVFWKNRDLVYLGCNAMFAQDAGVASPEELVGRDDKELVWREQAEKYRADDRQVIESGRSKLIIEESQTTPSGEVITLLTSKIPLRDSGGKIIGVLGVYLDISERKLAEEALRGSLEMQAALNAMLQRSLKDMNLGEKLNGHLETILSMPRLPILAKGAVFILNSDGNGLTLAAHRGLSPATQSAFGDIAMKHLPCGGPGAGASVAGGEHDVFCREIEPHGHYCAPIVAGGETLGVLGLYLKKGGAFTDSQVRFLLSVAGVMAENILHARTEEKLAQSQKMESVGRLAGGVAHDFNNILTAISGYTEFMLKGLEEHDPKKEDGKEIQKAVKRAGTLTRQLLAFSRRQILSPKAVDLNKCVGDITNMLRRLIGEDITLSTKLAPVPCTALLDVGQIEQVLVNLVVNARDAMPEGGLIELSTELLPASRELASAHPDFPSGAVACLKVRDTGCGMTEEVKKHLFEPFYTTKERGKGTGLGLSTVFGIVKQSGGDVSVESEPGSGTSFRVYFPVHLSGPLAPAPGARDSGAGGPRGSETVLLVEDEESLRNLGRRVLASSGYTVLAAGSGAEALNAMELHGKPVDLLLTDVVMPGMSGRELARKIADRKLTRRTLYMSGYTDDAIVKHGVLEAGLSFIYKPFSVDALLLKVRTVLDGPPEQAEA